MRDWTSLGQHKRHPEFPVVTRESRRNSRKPSWFPRHRNMKPFPATASQEKSHVRNWRSKRYLAPLMGPTKFPEIPVSLERNMMAGPQTPHPKVTTVPWLSKDGSWRGVWWGKMASSKDQSQMRALKQVSTGITGPVSL